MGLYEEAVEEAARRVAEAVESGKLRGRVLILLPPGNSRTAVAEALCRLLEGDSQHKCAVYTYKRGDVKAVEQSAGEDIAVVVPRDLAEAAELGKGLEAEYVFLPALYEEALERRGVRVEGWQKANYSFAGQRGVKLWPKDKGIHLSLLRKDAKEDEAERVSSLYKAESLKKRAKRALESLSQGYVDEIWRQAAELLKIGVPPISPLIDFLKELKGEEAKFSVAAALYHAAKDAKPLLERYEALTCEGAARYGLKCGEFIGLVRSYAGVPQRELEEVERDLGIYRFAVPHLAEEGGGLYLTDGFKARLVTAGGFEEKAEEILKALERGSFS